MCFARALAVNVLALLVELVVDLVVDQVVELGPRADLEFY